MTIPSYTGNPYNFFTPCAELDGSPTEAATLDSYRAVVQLRCAWEDRYSLASEVSALSIYQRNPESLARATSVAIEPLTRVLSADESSLWGVYEESKITIEYTWSKKSPQADGNGELWSEELQPTAEHLTVDPTNLRWKTAVAALSKEQAPGMLVRGLDYVLTHFDVASIPAAALTLVGCVNNATVTGLFLGLAFPAETLLFNPPTAIRRVVMGPTPSLKWTVTYRLTYKACGWNRYWDPKMGAFDSIQRYNGSTWVDYKQYTPAAFTGL